MARTVSSPGPPCVGFSLAVPLKKHIHTKKPPSNPYPQRITADFFANFVDMFILSCHFLTLICTRFRWNLYVLWHINPMKKQFPPETLVETHNCVSKAAGQSNQHVNLFRDEAVRGTATFSVARVSAALSWRHSLTGLWPDTAPVHSATFHTKSGNNWQKVAGSGREWQFVKKRWNPQPIYISAEKSGTKLPLLRKTATF